MVQLLGIGADPLFFQVSLAQVVREKCRRTVFLFGLVSLAFLGVDHKFGIDGLILGIVQNEGVKLPHGH